MDKQVSAVKGRRDFEGFNEVNAMTRALALIIAVNAQVAVIVAIAFYLEEVLEKDYPQSFDWKFVLVPLCLLSVMHGYYVMFRYLFRLDKEMRKK